MDISEDLKKFILVSLEECVSNYVEARLPKLFDEAFTKQRKCVADDFVRILLAKAVDK